MADQSPSRKVDMQYGIQEHTDLAERRMWRAVRRWVLTASAAGTCELPCMSSVDYTVCCICCSEAAPLFLRAPSLPDARDAAPQEHIVFRNVVSGKGPGILVLADFQGTRSSSIVDLRHLIVQQRHFRGRRYLHPPVVASRASIVLCITAVLLAKRKVIG